MKKGLKKRYLLLTLKIIFSLSSFDSAFVTEEGWLIPVDLRKDDEVGDAPPDFARPARHLN